MKLFGNFNFVSVESRQSGSGKTYVSVSLLDDMGSVSTVSSRLPASDFQSFKIGQSISLIFDYRLYSGKPYLSIDGIAPDGAYHKN